MAGEIIPLGNGWYGVGGKNVRGYAAARAERYRVLRAGLGSQKDVADLLEVHPQTISKRERGERPVTREAELALLYLREHEGER